MPPGSEIVAGAAATAAALVPLAIFWHVALLVCALALMGGWRPTERLAARLVALLPASVAIAAALHANPFTAIVLGGLAVGLAVLAQQSPREPIRPAPLVAVLPGLVLLAAGVFYPEFVAAPLWRAVYAAPLGVLPCPTLYAVLGLAMIAGLGSRAWVDTLATVALFYGAVGVVRMGVHLDLGLIAGALSLVALRWVYRMGNGPRPA